MTQFWSWLMWIPETYSHLDKQPGCQQKFSVFVTIYAYMPAAEALIWGAFKSGRNQATGFGGDNAPLLVILPTTTTTPPESDSWRNIKSLAPQVLVPPLWILALPGGRVGPDKRAGGGKRVEQKWRHLADWKGPHCGGITFYYWSLSHRAAQRERGGRHPACLRKRSDVW